jgi:hypothetical protein
MEKVYGNYHDTCKLQPARAIYIEGFNGTVSKPAVKQEANEKEITKDIYMKLDVSFIEIIK